MIEPAFSSMPAKEHEVSFPLPQGENTGCLGIARGPIANENDKSISAKHRPNMIRLYEFFVRPDLVSSPFCVLNLRATLAATMKEAMKLKVETTTCVMTLGAFVFTKAACFVLSLGSSVELLLKFSFIFFFCKSRKNKRTNSIFKPKGNPFG